MSEDIVTLVAEGQSFEVPRDVLATHSLYFSAALSSGMCESATGRFVFPNLSARQLSLVVQCARSKFTTWPFEDSPFEWFSTKPFVWSHNSCAAEAELDALLAVTEAADYLQISPLTRTSLDRLSVLLDRLFSSPMSIVDHVRHECHVFSACLEAWVRLNHVQDKSFAKLIQQHALQHPHLVLQPYVPDPALQPAVFELIKLILDSNLLCIPDEGVVLDLVLGWLTSLPELMLPGVDVVETLLDCVRLGLLSFEARDRLHAFWSMHYPNARWQQTLTCEEFANLMRQVPYEGPFSSLRCNIAPQPARFFDTRASTPVLVTLLPSFNKNTIEFRLFNLVTGEHRSLDIPSCHLTQLSSDSMGDGDFDGRIYLCHPSTDVKRHKSILVVLYHNPYACTVNGFMWCLGTCEAQWLPRLVLPTVENRSVNVTTSGCFRSRRIGVATLPGSGLHVYCAEPSNSEIWLYLFRFDASLWQWHLRASKLLFPNPLTGLALFTPVDHLSMLAPDGWLYANVEFVDRSDPREARIRRHNLHQTSHVRSHFFRFRPDDTVGLSVDLLPSPPFLIRIYRVLALSSPADSITSGHTYLFAFGTCSRDQTATQFCFNTETQQWVEWSSTTSLDADKESSARSLRPKLLVNLSPEILGFRGLVSVTHMLPQDSNVPPEIENDNAAREIELSTNPCEERHVTAEPTPATDPTWLVLIGRPDHHLCENKSNSSGIWFHRPQISVSAPTATRFGGAFEPRKPTFPLSSSFAQTLYQYPSPAVVLEANWDNLLRTSEVLRFRDAPYSESSVFKLNAQEPVIKRPFSALNCPLWGGWAASDSD